MKNTKLPFEKSNNSFAKGEKPVLGLPVCVDGLYNLHVLPQKHCKHW